MKFLSVVVLLFILPAYLFSQERQYTTTNRQAIKYYSVAMQDIDDHAYDEAFDQLQKAIEEDSSFVEAHSELGDMNRLMRRHQAAVTQYLKVIALSPDFSRAVYLKIGQEEISLARYESALTHLQKYLTYPDVDAHTAFLAKKLIDDCTFSIDAMQHPVPFKPVNMGPNINTANDEYYPMETADESELIFTRKINNNEDFYKSMKVNGVWQQATYLSDKINTPDHNEGAQSITQDGRFLFFSGCNRPDGLGSCDIFIAQKSGDDWVKPFNLGPPVNTPGWESQPSISADGRTLYFTSNRRGGYGGYDILKSRLTDKGWCEPENLGTNINTSFDEQSPFIHPDDSTLYFCSNGWPGLGGMDLFVSRLSKDGKWQKPVNLGYPINTSGDERGISLTAQGNYAFYSSDNIEGGFGGFDIYTFELPEVVRPHLVTYVKGKVSDAKTLQPLEAAVEIIDLQKNEPVYQDYSDADQGNFLATLTAGKNYGLNISKSGYLFYSQNFSLAGYGSKDPYNITVLLQPIEIGNKVILTNIFFDTNKFDLKPESLAELQKLVDFLSLNPSIKIEVSGHTDNVGNDELNQTLSENRAKAVYQFLIDSKIDPSRLQYKGYGKTQPIETNDTEEGRAKNRRTEFKIVAK